MSEMVNNYAETIDSRNGSSPKWAFKKHISQDFESDVSTAKYISSVSYLFYCQYAQSIWIQVWLNMF